MGVRTLLVVGGVALAAVAVPPAATAAVDNPVTITEVTMKDSPWPAYSMGYEVLVSNPSNIAVRVDIVVPAPVSSEGRKATAVGADDAFRIPVVQGLSPCRGGEPASTDGGYTFRDMWLYPGDTCAVWAEFSPTDSGDLVPRVVTFWHSSSVIAKEAEVWPAPGVPKAAPLGTSPNTKRSGQTLYACVIEHVRSPVDLGRKVVCSPVVPVG